MSIEGSVGVKINIEDNFTDTEKKVDSLIEKIGKLDTAVNSKRTIEISALLNSNELNKALADITKTEHFISVTINPEVLRTRLAEFFANDVTHVVKTTVDLTNVNALIKGALQDTEHPINVTVNTNNLDAKIENATKNKLYPVQIDFTVDSAVTTALSNINTAMQSIANITKEVQGLTTTALTGLDAQMKTYFNDLNHIMDLTNSVATTVEQTENKKRESYERTSRTKILSEDAAFNKMREIQEKESKLEESKLSQIDKLYAQRDAAYASHIAKVNSIRDADDAKQQKSFETNAQKFKEQLEKEIALYESTSDKRIAIEKQIASETYNMQSDYNNKKIKSFQEYISQTNQLILDSQKLSANRYAEEEVLINKQIESQNKLLEAKRNAAMLGAGTFSGTGITGASKQVSPGDYAFPTALGGTGVSQNDIKAQADKEAADRQYLREVRATSAAWEAADLKRQIEEERRYFSDYEKAYNENTERAKKLFLDREEAYKENYNRDKKLNDDYEAAYKHKADLERKYFLDYENAYKENTERAKKYFLDREAAYKENIERDKKYNAEYEEAYRIKADLERKYFLDYENAYKENTERARRYFLDREAAYKENIEMEKRNYLMLEEAYKMNEALDKKARMDRGHALYSGAAIVSSRSDIANLREYRQEYEKTQSAVQGVHNAMSMLANVMMQAGIFMSARQITEYADQWIHFTSMIRIASNDYLASIKELTQAQKDLFVQRETDNIFKISQETRTGIHDTAMLYSRMARAVESMNMPFEKATTLTEQLGKAMMVMGINPQMARGALLQLEQALGGVVVRGQEFKSVNDGLPIVMRLVAKEYNNSAAHLEGLQQGLKDGTVEMENFIKAHSKGAMTLKELRDLMLSGKMYSAVTADALTSKSAIDAMNASAEHMHVTFAQAFTVIENGFVKYVGQLNEASGASALFFEWAVKISNNFDTIATVLGSVVIPLGTFAVTVGLARQAVILFNFALQANPLLKLAGFLLAGTEALLAYGATHKETANNIKSYWDNITNLWDKEDPFLKRIKEWAVGTFEVVKQLNPLYQIMQLIAKIFDIEWTPMKQFDKDWESAKASAKKIREHEDSIISEQRAAFEKQQAADTIIPYAIGQSPFSGQIPYRPKEEPIYGSNSLNGFLYRAEGQKGAAYQAKTEAEQLADDLRKDFSDMAEIDAIIKKAQGNAEELRKARVELSAKANAEVAVSGKAIKDEIDTILSMKEKTPDEAAVQRIVDSINEKIYLGFKKLTANKDIPSKEELLKFNEKDIASVSPDLREFVKEFQSKQAEFTKMAKESYEKGQLAKAMEAYPEKRAAMMLDVERLDNQIEQIQRAAQIKTTKNPLKINTELDVSSNLDKTVERWRPQVEAAAKKWGVSSNLMMAIMQQESGGKEGLTSSAGARGLMQIMPPSPKMAQWYKDQYKTVDNVDTNLDMAAHLLSDLSKMKNVSGDVVKMLAGYNGRPSQIDEVMKAIAEGRKYGTGETQDYIRKVMSHYKEGDKTQQAVEDTIPQSIKDKLAPLIEARKELMNAIAELDKRPSDKDAEKRVENAKKEADIIKQNVTRNIQLDEQQQSALKAKVKEQLRINDTLAGYTDDMEKATAIMNLKSDIKNKVDAEGGFANFKGMRDKYIADAKIINIQLEDALEREREAENARADDAVKYAKDLEAAHARVTELKNLQKQNKSEISTVDSAISSQQQKAISTKDSIHSEFMSQIASGATTRAAKYAVVDAEKADKLKAMGDQLSPEDKAKAERELDSIAKTKKLKIDIEINQAALKEAADSFKEVADYMKKTFGHIGEAIGDLGNSWIGMVQKMSDANDQLKLLNDGYEKQKQSEEYQKLSAEEKGKIEKDYQNEKINLEQKYNAAAIGGIANIAGATSKMFAEHSQGRKVLHGIEVALHGVEMAMTLARTMAKMAEGAAEFFAQSGWAGFAGVAAMVAVMAGFGIMAGGSSSNVKDTSTKDTATTGTVLGDTEAASNSVKNIIDTLNNIHASEYETLKDIANGFKNMSRSIDGTIQLAVQQHGVFSGSVKGMSSSSVSPLGSTPRAIGGLVASAGMGAAGVGTAVLGAGANALIGMGATTIGSAVGGVATSMASGAISTGLAMGASSSMASLVGGMALGLAGGLVIAALQYGLGKLLGIGKVKYEAIGYGIVTKATEMIVDGSEKALVVYDYTKVKQTIKGWFSDTVKIYDTINGINEQLTGSISGVFSSFTKILKEYGEKLDITQYMDASFTIPKIKLSFTKLKSEDISKKITDALNTTMDNITTIVTNNLIKPFQKMGEGALEAFVRIGAEAIVVRETFKRAGYNLGNGGLGLIQISQTLLDLYESSEKANDGLKNFVSAFDALIKTITTTGEKLHMNLQELQIRLTNISEKGTALSEGTKQVEFNADFTKTLKTATVDFTKAVQDAYKATGWNFAGAAGKNQAAWINELRDAVTGKRISPMTVEQKKERAVSLYGEDVASSMATRNYDLTKEQISSLTLNQLKGNITGAVTAAYDLLTSRYDKYTSAGKTNKITDYYSASLASDKERVAAIEAQNKLKAVATNPTAETLAPYITGGLEKTKTMSQEQIISAAAVVATSLTNKRYDSAATATLAQAVPKLTNYDLGTNPLEVTGESIQKALDTSTANLAILNQVSAVVKDLGAKLPNLDISSFNTTNASQYKSLITNAGIEKQMIKGSGTGNAVFDFATMTSDKLTNDFKKNLFGPLMEVGQKGVYQVNGKDYNAFYVQFAELIKSNDEAVKKIKEIKADPAAYVKNTFKDISQDNAKIMINAVTTIMAISDKSQQIKAVKDLDATYTSLISSTADYQKSLTDAQPYIQATLTGITNIKTLAESALSKMTSADATKTRVNIASLIDLNKTDDVTSVLKMLNTETVKSGDILIEAVNKWLGTKTKEELAYYGVTDTVKLTERALKAYDNELANSKTQLDAAKTALTNFQKSIADWVQGMKITQLGNTKSQLDAASRQFDSLLLRIKTPTSAEDKNLAMTKITGAADAYVNAVRNYYGTSKAGADITQSIVDTMDTLPDSLSVQELMLGELQKIKENTAALPSFTGMSKASGDTIDTLSKAIAAAMALDKTNPTLANTAVLDAKANIMLVLSKATTGATSADAEFLNKLVGAVGGDKGLSATIDTVVNAKLGVTSTNAALDALKTSFAALEVEIEKVKINPTAANTKQLQADIDTFNTLTATVNATVSALKLDPKNQNLINNVQSSIDLMNTFSATLTGLTPSINLQSSIDNLMKNINAKINNVVLTPTKDNFDTLNSDLAKFGALNTQVKATVTELTANPNDPALKAKLQSDLNSLNALAVKVGLTLPEDTKTTLDKKIQDVKPADITIRIIFPRFDAKSEGVLNDVNEIKDMVGSNLSLVLKVPEFDLSPITKLTEALMAANDKSMTMFTAFNSMLAKAGEAQQAIGLLQTGNGVIQAFTPMEGDVRYKKGYVPLSKQEGLNQYMQSISSAATDKAYAAGTKMKSDAAQKIGASLYSIFNDPSSAYNTALSYVMGYNETHDDNQILMQLTPAEGMISETFKKQGARITPWAEKDSKGKPLSDAKISANQAAAQKKDLDAAMAKYKAAEAIAKKQAANYYNLVGFNEVNTLSPIKYATGGVFTNSVVNTPTPFNMGLMGEAGPEAIMPLVQTSGGLGVRALPAANDSNKNTEIELAEMKKQNQILIAQNAILQEGFKQLINLNNKQADSLDNIESNNRRASA